MALFIILSGGCMTPAKASVPVSYSITMKSPSRFIVNDREVDIANLIKALQKDKAPKDVPIIIQIPANTSMETISILTQKLATAGYKPVCKRPRQANSFVNGAR